MMIQMLDQFHNKFKNSPNSFFETVKHRFKTYLTPFYATPNDVTNDTNDKSSESAPESSL